MCGRYSLTIEQEALAVAVGVARIHHPRPRYNIAPTQSAPVIEYGSEGFVAGLRRWGLVPSWADSPTAGPPLINARSETAATRPSFRTAFMESRCLVPADGFFEWTEQGGRKLPWHIRRPDGEPFTFGGLAARWESPRGEVVESFTLLTTDADENLRSLHHRMPVVVDTAERERWLDPSTPPAALRELLAGATSEGFVARRVSTRVNSPSNDDPTCVEALADEGGDSPSPEQTTLF